MWSPYYWEGLVKINAKKRTTVAVVEFSETIDSSVRRDRLYQSKWKDCLYQFFYWQQFNVGPYPAFRNF